MVTDEQIALLFTASGEDLERIVEDTMARAERASGVERTLLELLEAAVDEGIDDTNGAVWISLILGELQSREAIPLFLRALSQDDESLAEAAVDALRRIGEPALDAVMQALDADTTDEFQESCFKALEGAGAWDHPYLVEEARDCVLGRLEAGGLSDRGLEAAAMALARLGDRRAIEPIKAALAERFHNVNGSLTDALEMLEENEAGTPLLPGLPSWEDRLTWLSRASLEGFEPPQRDRGPKRRRPTKPKDFTPP